MLLLVALLAEVAVAPVTSADLHFDLKEILSDDPCGASAGDEIVICGRKADPARFRLGATMPDEPPLLGKAETTLFGDVEAAVEGEHTEFGGAASNRMMLRLKKRF